AVCALGAAAGGPIGAATLVGAFVLVACGDALFRPALLTRFGRTLAPREPGPRAFLGLYLAGNVGVLGTAGSAELAGPLVGWWLGFGVCAGAMLLSVALLAAGRRLLAEPVGFQDSTASTRSGVGPHWGGILTITAATSIFMALYEVTTHAARQ